VPENEAHRPSVMARVAAVVALIALVAAIGLVLLGVVRHFLAVLSGLACLIICVTAGWYVVSRRGIVRAVAVIVMLAAVAGLITSLIFEDYHGLAALGLIVVAAVSVVSARYALRAPAERARVAAMNATPVAAAEHPVLIMNLKSGGGKAEKFRLADECENRGIEPIVLQPGDDLLQLAQDAIARGADAIGMAGGDGSQALVATVASRCNVPHVCVPAGTRNHFALDLGLDRGDVVGALDAFADAFERRIDLGSVNGRVFVNNASLGLYAKVVQSPEYRDAKISTAASILPGLLGPDAKPLDLRFRGPDAYYPTAHLILVSNDPYRMDHVGNMGTRSRLDLGVLGIVATRIADAAQARRFVALEAAGRVRRFPGWLEWRAPKFVVGSGGPVEIGLDGEALQMDPPLVFESLPGALRVRVPRRAVQPSRRARAVRLLSASTIAELGRVVAGSYG
jgi:diacylglycerol kinase family enzyme